MAVKNGHQIIKQTKMIHMAIAIMVVLFAFTAIFISKQGSIASSIQPNVVLYVVSSIVAVAAFVLSAFVYKKQIDVAVSKSTLLQKLESYRAACITRFAIMEVGMMFCLILFFLSGAYFFLIVTSVLMVFYIMYTPSADQAVSHLLLNATEAESLEDHYAELS